MSRTDDHMVDRVGDYVPGPPDEQHRFQGGQYMGEEEVCSECIGVENAPQHGDEPWPTYRGKTMTAMRWADTDDTWLLSNDSDVLDEVRRVFEGRIPSDVRRYIEKRDDILAFLRSSLPSIAARGLLDALE